MDPEAFRAAAHAVVDLMADYLAGVEAYPVLPPIEPGSLRPAFPARAAGGARAARGHPRRLPDADRAERHALAAPGLLRLLRVDGVRARDPRRDAGRRRSAQNPMLWRTSPIGTELEERRRRLAAPGARAAADVRRAAHRHGLDVVAHRARRPRARRPGSTPRHAGWRTRPELGAPRVYASAEAHSSIEKACMTLGHRPGRRSSGSRRTSAIELRLDALAAGDRRRPGRGPDARSRSSPRSGRPSSTSVDPGRPPSPTSPSARVSGSTSTRRTPGRSRSMPESRGAVRRLGAGRLDRRQPAQVAVHAVRRLAPADPPDGRAPGARSARSRSTCARSTGRPRSATTASTSRSSGGASGRSSCGCCCATSGSTGCAGGSSTTSSWAARSPTGSTPSRTGSASRRSRSRRSASAGVRRASPAARTSPRSRRRSTSATRRSSTRSTGPARSSCRTPGSAAGSRSGCRSSNLRTEERHVERAWELLRREATRLQGAAGGRSDG